MVCKIFFCSEFPNILEKAGRKARRKRRRRTQAIAKHYVFHANAIKQIPAKNHFFLGITTPFLLSQLLSQSRFLKKKKKISISDLKSLCLFQNGQNNGVEILTFDAIRSYEAQYHIRYTLRIYFVGMVLSGHSG